MFVGGPVKDFTQMGRHQLEVLLHEGLLPESRVLDVGCGCLCGGYWIMRMVNPGCYFGIEPNETMLQAGLDHIVEPEVLTRAEPRFDSNDKFDFGVFGCQFDFVIARSIWSHASKAQITTMLDSFVNHGAPDAVFLATYFPRALRFVPTRFWKRSIPAWFPRAAARMPTKPDYRGDQWRGRSATSDEPGLVSHSFAWIVQECQRRGLDVRQLRHLHAKRQQWLRISRR